MKAILLASAVVTAASTVPMMAQTTDDAAPNIARCDAAAFHPENSDNPNGVTPVDFDDLAPRMALPICERAHKLHPEHVRTLYHLGRLHHAAENEAQAVRFLSLSAEEGYVFAFINLIGLFDGSTNSFGTDVARARAYAALGCNQGNASACVELGERKLNAATPDRAAALDHFDTAMESYRAGCDIGIGFACQNAGHLLNDTDKPINDDALSLRFFERGCALEDANACANIGWMHRWRDVPAQSDEIALTRLREGCEAGEHWACGQTGLAIKDGLAGEEPDYQQALSYMERGCDAGNGYSCRQAGRLLDGSVESMSYVALSLRFAERGCELGDARSCADIGWLHRWLDVPGQSDEIALTRLREGCEAGEHWACGQTGWAIKDGLAGEEPDYELALSYMERGCDAGNGFSCQNAGHLLNDTDKPINDDALSLRFFERGCALKDANACANIGWMHRWRDVPGQSDEIALTRLREGCEAGEHWACGNTGLAIEDGLAGEEPDYELALSYMERGCDGDHGWSCRKAGHLLIDTDKPIRNDAQALRFFERGCALEDVNACANIGRMHGYRNVPGQSDEIALTRLREGCEAGERWACDVYFGFLDDNTSFVQREYRNFDLECKSGSSGACWRLGVIALMRDADQPAFDAFTRSCDIEPSVFACAAPLSMERGGDLLSSREITNLFDRFVDGLQNECATNEIPFIPISATLSATHGFELMEIYSCADFAGVIYHGTELKEGYQSQAYPERATSILESSCSRGIADGCRVLGYALNDAGEYEAAESTHIKACEQLHDARSCVAMAQERLSRQDVSGAIDFAMASFATGSIYLLSNMTRETLTQDGIVQPVIVEETFHGFESPRIYGSTPDHIAFRKGIQRELSALGLYAGAIDGVIGPMTIDSIEDYASRFE